MIYQYSEKIFIMVIGITLFVKHITDLSIGYFKHQLACSAQSFITPSKHLLNFLLIIF